MAAARQKEMNVSITEEATISLTRSFGGATVVRVEAIARVPARQPVAQGLLEDPENRMSETTALRMSLFCNQCSVNEK